MFSKRLAKFIFRLRLLFERYWNESFSQEGEDMILFRIFESYSTGFYLDIGAHHPKRFSNTYFFYKRGWRGINIDAAPGSMKTFNIERTRDINIEAAISDKEEEVMFYVFEEPAFNTFDKKRAEIQVSNNRKLINQIKLKTKKLENILDESIPEGQQIDFLSIDTEGYDLNILKSNNFDKFRPMFILVECLENENFIDIVSDEVYKYLVGKEYSLFAKTVNTCFFKDVRNDKF